MGVKGLQSYIEKRCPEVMIPVSLATIGHRFYRHHGKQAVLVIDGMSCLQKFYHPGIPWVYGGQWRQYVDQIEKFLKALERAKIEPVFFFDGRVENKKRDEWVKRRISNRINVAKIFEYIKETGCEPSEKLYHIPVALPQLTIMALKSLGATVHNTRREADYEIAKYCKEFNCLGILGQDTDFIIYNIGEYFSSQYLKLDSLTTISYSRNVLCSKLQMPIYQLPLLACLMGNDFISREDLESFHKYLGQGRIPWAQKLVPMLSNYAASYGNRLLSRQDITYIESQVFGRDRSKFGRIHESVSMYYLELENVGETMPERRDGQISGNRVRPIHATVLELTKKQQRFSDSIVWNVTKTGIVDCGMSFEDDNDPNLPSSSPVLRPVRQRMYGLLYGIGVKAKNGGNGMKVEGDGIRARAEGDGIGVKSKDDKIRVKAVSEGVRVKAEVDGIEVKAVSEGVRVHAAGESIGVKAEGDLTRGLTENPRTTRSDAGEPVAMPTDHTQLVVGQNAVMEWHVYKGNPLKEPDIVPALPLDSLKDGTPSLEYLWLHSGPEVTECRLLTYLACMDCSISMATIKQIPPEYVIPCTLVNYFLKSLPRDVFGEIELSAFLATFVTLPLYDVNALVALEVSEVKGKGIHLATMFMRGVSTAIKVDAACGKPVATGDELPWKYFDGKLFHAKYLIALQTTNTLVLCQKNEDVAKLFELLRQCVLEGRRS